MNEMIQSIIQTAVSGGSTMGLVQKYLNSQNPNDPKVAQARRMIFGNLRENWSRSGEICCKRPERLRKKSFLALGVHF